MVLDKKTDKKVHRVKFTFIITDENDSEGQPFVLNRTMNVSLGEKAHLGQMLRQLGVDTTKRLNLAELKDMEILANVTESKVGDKVYANVDSVTVTFITTAVTPWIWVLHCPYRKMLQAT